MGKRRGRRKPVQEERDIVDILLERVRLIYGIPIAERDRKRLDELRAETEAYKQRVHNE